MESNRGQHLPANWATATALTIVDNAITGSSLAMVTGLSCAAVEFWAWPDRDIEHKRRGLCFIDHHYWLLYEQLIPRHRHPLSHSLLPGLVIRLVWGFWPIVFALQDVEEWGAVWPIVLPVLLRVGIGAIASDCTHYAMDGYAPWEWLAGKK